jgi:hypothetical protein
LRVADSGETGERRWEEEALLGRLRCRTGPGHVRRRGRRLVPKLLLGSAFRGEEPSHRLACFDGPSSSPPAWTPSASSWSSPPSLLWPVEEVLEQAEEGGDATSRLGRSEPLALGERTLSDGREEEPVGEEEVEPWMRRGVDDGGRSGRATTEREGEDLDDFIRGRDT